MTTNNANIMQNIQGKQPYFNVNNSISWSQMFNFGWLEQQKTRTDFVSLREFEPMSFPCIFNFQNIYISNISLGSKQNVYANLSYLY